MPGRTPLDHALNSRNTFLAFTGIVTAVAAWSIWGQDMFPAQADPTGDPATWSEPDLRRWLTSVRTNLLPSLPPLLFFLTFLSLAYLWFHYRLRPRRILKGTKHVKSLSAAKTLQPVQN